MIGPITSHPTRKFPRVSYAQNREDILLDRLFGDHVGRYMDIGSYHPILGNNTFFFYERGWRGVNIEPTRQGHELFQQHRPEDINLPLAASDHDGELTLYEVVRDRGNSTLQREIAELYRARGVEIVAHAAPVRTIRSLIDSHGIEPPDILSIDVEGHEAAVIRGTPLDSWRPRVLVVEATLPLTTTPSHQDWEPILLAQGYLFAAFNGVNRFYLREDLRDRLDRLATPVNVLDHFVPHDVVVLHERAADLKRRLAHEQDRMAVERAGWQARLTAFEAEQAEWARRRSALEQHIACLQGQLEATQRQLRPYRLLDGLGVITVGYGLARKLKHRLVS